ncbi:hypothetical protein D3C85_465820 [compost metagenome]
MVQVHRQMMDLEMVYIKNLNEERRARMAAKHGDIIAEEIMAALVEMEMDPQVISARAVADALDRNTAALEKNTEMLMTRGVVREEDEHDRMLRELRSGTVLTRMELSILTCEIPPHVEEIKDFWHMWEIMKYNRVANDIMACESDKASQPLIIEQAQIKPKRTNWGWKKHTDKENCQFLFSKIDELFQQNGKLPTTTQFYSYHQTGYAWAMKRFDGQWQNVIDAYIKAQ